MPFDPLRRHVLAGLGAAGAAMAVGLPALAREMQRRGINISLWLDQDDGSEQPPSAEVLHFLRECGFSAIRLPLSPVRFAAASTAELGKLATLLRDLHDLGFAVTLDLHPLGQFREALEAGSDAEIVLEQAWAALAAACLDVDPDLTALELLNEPPMWQDRWLPLRERLAAIVRARTAEHLIIWGANRYQRFDETMNCPPLADDNVQVAVHYYTPMDFTHQCQNWGGAAPTTARSVFPSTSWDAAAIDRDFAQLAAWATGNRTTVLLNEFGTLGFCSDRESRAIWTRAVRKAAERHAINWTYWELDRGFGFLESRQELGTVDHAILDSLLGASA